MNKPRALNCTQKQFCALLARNIESMRADHARAIQSGKKIRGLNASQILEKIGILENSLRIHLGENQ